MKYFYLKTNDKESTPKSLGFQGARVFWMTISFSSKNIFRSFTHHLLDHQRGESLFQKASFGERTAAGTHLPPTRFFAPRGYFPQKP